ncbi:Cupin domain-containing protein [Thermomonospora echinospora]|uniref:Cupin domain-containing protein n=2 Tax=Thermomonospora echinospora TaxID=1992 RepID=A0A1H6D666_9ACTN|nr:Cupin domain-containing protein [Thermomonospora echinospora]
MIGMEIIPVDRCAGPDGGAHYVEHLRVEALSVGTYSIPAGGTDPQRPHTEDEVYVVIGGRGAFTGGDRTVPVGPGTVLYVPKHEEHRFHDVTEDLVICVMFAPAEGSAAGGA